MTIVFVIVIGYLFNDQSTLYIFKPDLKIDEQAKANENEKEKEKEMTLVNGLTPEEQQIHKSLTEKIQRTSVQQVAEVPVAKDLSSDIAQTYTTIMSRF